MGPRPAWNRSGRLGALVAVRGPASPSCGGLHGGPFRRRAAAALLALAGALLAGEARGQAYGDPAEGRRLATAWCSGCHQVDPQAKGVANDAVPSFKAIAAMPSTTMLSIRVFLRTPHDVMPDFRLSEEQIDDLGAYILGLSGQRPE